MSRPPRNERLVSEIFMCSFVRNEVQRKVDDGCRQCEAKVYNYISSTEFLDTFRTAFDSALPDWLLCDDTLVRIATAVFN